MNKNCPFTQYIALNPSPTGLYHKSVNLQYHTLGRLEWDKRIVDQASDVPSSISFHDFLQNSLQKSFQFIFLFFL